MGEEQTVEVREEPRLFGRLAWYRRRIDALEQQAVIDDLTGLRNQRALWRELSRRAPACSDQSPLAVVMVDFDLFKEINEGYGHAVGDAVLRRAAAVLRDAAISPRLAFRYGGEEFVLLLPGDEDDGRALAERVRSEVTRQNGALPAVTVSCGVAQLDRPVEPWVALDRADTALREAKRRGRNRVVLARDADGARSAAHPVEEIEQETAKRAALALAVATLEVRDRDTASHSDDVLTLCEAMGRELRFDARALRQLVAGAQLHDVGKVGVPSAILEKPGPLAEGEWEIMREHTVVGERILRSVPEMAEVAMVVRHSHEHWDGSGYPDGLAGEDIPLASRVILCADAFHAIRSDRPYRASRSAADALAEIQACAGTQFDPVVVDALVAVAADVRERRGAGFPLPRNKRLIALLATLIIGGGSAVAGVPEVRDAIRSVFGSATAPPTEVVAGEPAEGWGFGPLGDLLSIAPAAVDQQRQAGREERTLPGAREERAGRRGLRSAGRGGFGTGEASRPGAGRLNGGGAPGKRPPSKAPVEDGTPKTPVQDGPSSDGPASGQQGGGTPAPIGTGPQAQSQSGPQEGSSGDNGRGRGLGRDVPTPRSPAQPPGQAKDGPGRPQTPGRTDPPALGRDTPPNRRAQDAGDGGSAGSDAHPGKRGR